MKNDFGKELMTAPRCACTFKLKREGFVELITLLNKTASWRQVDFMSERSFSYTPAADCVSHVSVALLNIVNQPIIVYLF